MTGPRAGIPERRALRPASAAGAAAGRLRPNALRARNVSSASVSPTGPGMTRANLPACSTAGSMPRFEGATPAPGRSGAMRRAGPLEHVPIAATALPQTGEPGASHASAGAVPPTGINGQADGSAAPAPDGAARCGTCAAKQAGRPSRREYARKQYARRRVRGACADCGEHAAGASRCPTYARRSWHRSTEHRGLPAGPPRFRVVVIDTGETLEGEWETLAEARASLAFAKLGPDDVEIGCDMPGMTTLASW